MLGEYLDGFTDRDWRETTGGTVRLALIGLGWWVRDEAIPAVAESDFCTATVAVSGSAEKAERVAAEHGMAAGITYDRYHDGAAADEYDAVYVCTPNATHLEFVETAAALGKDVLCEKPMEATVERAEAMVAACEEVTLMVAYRMQTEPAVRRAHELIAEGAIGDPVHVHGHKSTHLLEHIDDPDQWRLTPELSGGTTVNDIGIYPLNTTRFLLAADPHAVYATTRSESDPFEGVDEHTAFHVEFPGTTAVCTASHNAHQCSHLRVVGDAGELLVEPAFFPWDDRALRLSRGGADAEVAFEQVNQMTEEFDYFADCLLADRDPVPDGEHGLVDLRAIEGVYEAAETGRRVEL